MPIPKSDPLVTVPMVTPFKESDEIDCDAAQFNVELWNKTATSGFIIGSQSGEELYLNESERLELLSVVTDSLSGDRYTIGGIDSPSALETLRQAENYAKAGAEMVRIRFPRQESVLESYFQEVIPRLPVPVLLMHQCEPKSFGLAASPAGEPEVLGGIASMDGVFGYVTDHDMRFEARVRRVIPETKRFWICNGSMILLGTLIGCNGTTTAFSNIWPDAMKQLLDFGMSSQHSRGKTLQDLVSRIDEVMLPYLAAGIKSCLKLMGFKGMVPRKPTAEVPEECIIRIEALLREAELI